MTAPSSPPAPQASASVFPSSPPAQSDLDQSDLDQSDLDVARRALDLEAEGLRALGAGLDDAFVAAVDTLQAVTGRVVVTGMGKSGHIGRKIAATLASTGAPAMYVHPGEASHGDLGMIAGGDAVIALSNSGNTAELSDVIAYTRRFAIPLIGITAKRESTLARQADHILQLPRAAEACPMGLAPTTSTTMMLALGDALAVTLLARKGFTSRDFKVLHPGGSLGQQLLRVSALMHGREELPLAPPDMPMREALLVMTARRFGCLGITDAPGTLMGVVTDGDLRRHMNADLLSQRVDSIMTAAPKTIRGDALAAEALGVMNRLAITSLFVVDDTGVPEGILHIHDCLRAGVV